MKTANNWFNEKKATEYPATDIPFKSMKKTLKEYAEWLKLYNKTKKNGNKTV